jgi:hypothetical protein
MKAKAMEGRNGTKGRPCLYRQEENLGIHHQKEHDKLK